MAALCRYALSLLAVILAVASWQAAERPVADGKATDLHGDPLPAGARARMGTYRWWHPSAVNFVACLDDKRLVTGCQDGLFRVLDVATGKELRRFVRPGDDEAAAQRAADGIAMYAGAPRYGEVAALSADGKLLAALHPDRVIRLWDVDAGAFLRELPNVNGSGYYSNAAPVFSPDGKALAVLAPDQSVRLYETATAKEIRILVQPQAARAAAGDLVVYHGGPGSMTFTPDGKALAVIVGKNARRTGFVQVLDVQSGAVLRSLDGPANAYTNAGAVAFSPDGKTIAWSTISCIIRFLDAETGKEIGQCGEPKPGFYHDSLRFAPDGKMLLSRIPGSATIHLWDVATGKAAGVCKGEGRPIVRSFPQGANHLAFAPDGKTLVEGLPSYGVSFWDVPTATEQPESVSRQTWIVSLALAPDGKTLTTASLDGMVRRWETATGKELHEFKASPSGRTILLTPDGKLAVGGAANNELHVRDSATGAVLHKIAVPTVKDRGGVVGGAAGLVMAPDGKTLAHRGQDQILRVYATATGKELAALDERKTPDPSIVFTPSGRGMALAPDGRLLATAGMIHPPMGLGLPGSKPRIVLWDVQAAQPVGRIVLTRNLSGLEFAPDGATVATANDDGTVSLWEVSSGLECLAVKLQEPQPPRRQCGASGALAFSQDGRTLAVAAADNTVRLLELPDGKEIGRLAGHRAAVLGIAFAPDNAVIVTSSSDTTALVWAGERLLPRAPAPGALDGPRLEALWQELVGEPPVAHRARCTLAQTPQQTVELLKAKLKPTPAVDEKMIDQRIADLDSEQFAVRERAAAALEELGDLAQPKLQALLKTRPSLETRQRAERLLERLAADQPPAPEALRNLRAAQLLEQIASPAAQELLGVLAKGAPGDKLTLAATAAARRLSARLESR